MTKLPCALLAAASCLKASKRSPLGLISWDNGVAGCLQLVEFDHDVAGQDAAELALAPSLVELRNFWDPMMRYVLS